jgi:hypothetical protein
VINPRTGDDTPEPDEWAVEPRISLEKFSLKPTKTIIYDVILNAN